MSELKNLFDSLNIPEEKIKELINTVTTNPMMAMPLLSELNIPAETMQKMMAIVMANPSELIALAKEFGVSEETVNDVASKVLPTDNKSKIKALNNNLLRAFLRLNSN